MAANTYFEDPKHCADLMNGFWFHGKQYILPKNIQIRNQNSALPRTKEKKKRSIVINRDVVLDTSILSERVNNSSAFVYSKLIQMKTVIIALENQSDIHYAMPIRVMSGDSAKYHDQWRKLAKEHKEKKDLEGMEYLSGISKSDKLTPVSTIVVYFGEDPWDGPRCLKDMLELEGLPPEILDVITDYPLNLLEIRNYPDYENFQTDLRLVCGFLQRDNDAEALLSYIEENEQKFANLPEDTYNLISNFSHSGKLIETRELYQTEKGGIDMCKAIDDLIAQGEERGIERGIISLIKLCQEFNVTLDLTMKRIMTDFSLTEEKAKEYIVKYWI